MNDLCPLPDINSTFQVVAWIAIVFLSLLFRKKQVQGLDLSCARKDRTIAALRLKLEAGERELASLRSEVRTARPDDPRWDAEAEDWVF